jgi:tagaturonate epimerase
MVLEKYSIGVGDRFGHQGVAQLKALQAAKNAGVNIVPVWNKSNREHQIIGTIPADARRAADNAVLTLGWKDSYYVDADHIGLKTVAPFLAVSDFFTLDVADFIGKPASDDAIAAFVDMMRSRGESAAIPGIATPVSLLPDDLRSFARKYLLAVQEAGKIYRHIAAQRKTENFVVEISTDEASQPQTPAELYLLLAAIAAEKIPVQTIAPKFTGDFLKGIDYVGNVAQFAKEFEEDVLVIAHAVRAFQLPSNLKLSVHSGSDKFSIYPFIHRIIVQRHAGLHLKTAGTTWLEELIGIAMAGGEGLDLARDVYAQAHARIDELCKPYETVIAIDRAHLPSPADVRTWSSSTYASALRHDPAHRSYNKHLRQLLHVGYKVAAEMGERYIRVLEASQEIVGTNVTDNLLLRHINPIFIGTR